MTDLQSGGPAMPKRGATPTPRNLLAAAMPLELEGVAAAAPPQFLTVPAKISMWGNDVHGDCVTAEEAFAKACHNPELYVPDADVIAWAKKHNVLEGAVIHDVLVTMQKDGFREGRQVWDDGPSYSVDWHNAAVLQSAIAQGPVKIGVAADQLETVWHKNGGRSGWIATGFRKDTKEDHCTSLCGYGSIAWLAQQLHASVPAGVNRNAPAYAMFTWNTIGIVDVPSLLAITYEAWVRRPTTVVK